MSSRAMVAFISKESWLKQGNRKQVESNFISTNSNIASDIISRSLKKNRKSVGSRIEP